jgi:hypothetical protein
LHVDWLDRGFLTFIVTISIHPLLKLKSANHCTWTEKSVYAFFSYSVSFFAEDLCLLIFLGDSIMERKSLKWFYIVNIGLFVVGNDNVSGVPKAAKNNQNYTSPKLSIATRCNDNFTALVLTSRTSQTWQFHSTAWVKKISFLSSKILLILFFRLEYSWNIAHCMLIFIFNDRWHLVEVRLWTYNQQWL